MAENQALAAARKCITACNGKTTCMDKCETTFKKAGGTVSAIDGGKVFTAPDGTGSFSVTDGGKVF